jgi:hypothetical protein
MIFMTKTCSTFHRQNTALSFSFQLYLWKKTSGDPACFILSTNGHLSSPTGVRQARLIDSSHERIEGPCRDLNPQRWGASGINDLNNPATHALISEQIYFKKNYSLFSLDIHLTMIKMSKLYNNRIGQNLPIKLH